MDASFMVAHQRARCCDFVELAGDLDLATAQHLEAVLEGVANPDHFTVDVSQLTFIDSTGLRLLMRASDMVEGRIWLKGPSRHLLRLLEVSGISELFCLEVDRFLAHRIISKGRASRKSRQIESGTAFALDLTSNVRQLAR